ncbi:glycosyltransferase family 4 protein [Aureimonas fodinaquatilis]|uniref:Glycosyltransferase family 4 protein n=1 Tax=Aureimonas fodinaquatilis TaxID=2565783 RepID=A0A5B0E2B1_9HYPH|nr:glycosyltransferase family 4 protein [Aureimonas fodinaquatilis]KAA0971880.1 glycosyltransferase family 4 protein [Aureimonas fodinaquatilis]
MRHVWILNHYVQVPGGPGGTRHISLGRHLPEHGWQATLIAASTDHSSGAQRLAEGEAHRLDFHDGVPVLWLRTRNYRGNGRDRIANMLDYTRAVLRRGSLAELAPPDLIVGSSVHPLAAWAGMRLARRHGVPFVFEVRDLWPQTLIDMGRISTWHPAAIALRLLERSLYNAASRIIVLLPNAKSYIVPLGIDCEKIVWIPNGVDVERFPTLPRRKADDRFVFMYLGAHGTANGLETLVQAMRLLQANPAARHISLRLIGAGPQKEALRKLAAGLNNLIFEDPVAKAAVPQVAAEADAFVFCLKDTPVFRYGISSNKLFDYMAAARPIVSCCNAANNVVSEAGAGLSTPAGQPGLLADRLLEMASLPFAHQEAMGQAGRTHLLQHYSMEHLSHRFAMALDACQRI